MVDLLQEVSRVVDDLPLVNQYENSVKLHNGQYRAEPNRKIGRCNDYPKGVRLNAI